MGNAASGLSCGFSSWGHTDLFSCGPWAYLLHTVWELSSPSRDQTCVPCSGRQILNHWTTGEVLVVFCRKLLSFRGGLLHSNSNKQILALEVRCSIWKQVLDVWDWLWDWAKQSSWDWRRLSNSLMDLKRACQWWLKKRMREMLLEKGGKQTLVIKWQKVQQNFVPPIFQFLIYFIFKKMYLAALGLIAACEI